MKIIPDLSTNQKMATREALVYIENATSYFRHLTEYFNEPLNKKELNRLVYLIERVEYFLADHDQQLCNDVIRGRYQRVLTNLQLCYNANYTK